MALSTAAIEAREKAAAKFKAAASLVEGKAAADITGELETSFNALMAEAKTADEQFVALAGKDGMLDSLKDRMSFYHEAATGKPLPWQQIATLDRAKSWGEQFVESAEYKALSDSGALVDGSRSSFASRFEVKAPTDVVRVGSATGGQALLTPQYLPGIIPLPQRPLTIRDLFAQATTTAETISYARQTAFENGATTVAEATATGGSSGTKPQSSIGWTRQTAVVETIATWMATTRQMLSQPGQIRSLIDNQLELMVRLEEEDQLLNGNGTSPNISGLLDQPTLQTLDLTAATGTRANLDGLRTAKRLVRTGAARMNADGVVINPIDSEEFDLMVDDEGRYRAGDPFGSYGSENPPIWRMRRVESEAVEPGTAIVGAFRAGGTVYQREGFQVFTSDSHADFFVRNLVAILGEERLGLAIFFPAAFVIVTLKDWDATS